MKFLLIFGLCGLVLVGIAATVGLPLPANALMKSPCPDHASVASRLYLTASGPEADVAMVTEDDEALRACLQDYFRARDKNENIRNIRVSSATLVHPDQIRLKGRVRLYHSKLLSRDTKLQDGRISWTIDEDGLLLRTYTDLDIWGELYDKTKVRRRGHDRLSNGLNCWGKLKGLSVSPDQRRLVARVSVWRQPSCHRRVVN